MNSRQFVGGGGGGGGGGGLTFWLQNTTTNTKIPIIMMISTMISTMDGIDNPDPTKSNMHKKYGGTLLFWVTGFKGLAGMVEWTGLSIDQTKLTMTMTVGLGLDWD